MTLMVFQKLDTTAPKSRRAKIGRVTWKSRFVQTHGDRWVWISAEEAENIWEQRKLGDQWGRNPLELEPPIRSVEEIFLAGVQQ